MSIARRQAAAKCQMPHACAVREQAPVNSNLAFVAAIHSSAACTRLHCRYAAFVISVFSTSFMARKFFLAADALVQRTQQLDDEQIQQMMSVRTTLQDSYRSLMRVDLPGVVSRFIDRNADQLHEWIISLAQALRTASVVGSALGISFYIIAWVVLCLDFRAQVLQARRGVWQFNVQKVAIGTAFTYIGTQVSNGLLTYVFVSSFFSFWIVLFAWNLTWDLLLWWLRNSAPPHVALATLAVLRCPCGSCCHGAWFFYISFARALRRQPAARHHHSHAHRHANHQDFFDECHHTQVDKESLLMGRLRPLQDPGAGAYRAQARSAHHKPNCSLCPLAKVMLCCSPPQVVAGLVKALVRFALVVLVTLFSLPRIDRSPFPAWLEMYLLLDTGSKSYQGVILLYHSYNNPVFRVACWLLQEDAANRADPETAARLGLCSTTRRRISNRWYKAWIMYKNPVIASYSSSGGPLRHTERNPAHGCTPRVRYSGMRAVVAAQVRRALSSRSSKRRPQKLKKRSARGSRNCSASGVSFVMP